MGLFTLMAPPPGSAADWFLYGDAGYEVTLEAAVDGWVVATTTARRQDPLAAGVVEKKLRPAKGGLYGNLYLPETTAARRPAVLVFSGSGGGLTTSSAAALLAAHGYPSLALAYFKVPGLPQTLHNIPLEYFTRALKLLLGAHFPRLVNGVIAGVPSSVVNPGERPDASKPAWTLGGRPLPAVSPSEFGRPDQTSDPRAVIPVERIRGAGLAGMW
jgi:hypothetical protein